MTTPTVPDAGRTHPPVRLAACPKAMAYGPCGGVNADETCEVEPAPCVFLQRDLPVRWDGDDRADLDEITTASGRELQAIARRRPLVMTGFPVRALHSDAVGATAAALSGSTDAVLSGDAGRSRVQFPPSYRAALITATGLRLWMGFNARDRNRTALDRELASLQALGVAGVHCVTGDHTRTGDRPDARPVFDLESTTVLPRARALGLLTSFAESPAAPPIAERGARVAQKQRAGGRMCLTQYAGDADEVAAFVELCRAAGASAPVLPGVPLVVDRDGAALLASFHAAKLPVGFIDRLFSARDIRAEGIRRAVGYGHALLGTGLVGGVVIAGGARLGEEVAYASDLATVARELGGGS
ncbi:methylenetetrahydrofolate reductase C-terminal domain-containing protein [Microbacterium sp. SORGH_AS_0888]|uniref:methylenetetrahydrofolate reductase C-terminal domain-containing protein n=1 Tax=Microbacterium sp. SORGH_AS_0888 TaxID=3041791 RepID=UPI00278A4C8A|nr:methylenetetrahydrofolate reductase C-terminal domain-containing protein [Microbacterium sp. SORGH_AS_0888]MDQ1128942.1 methylenetetrahydrofolate reductase (NADPH) [Microbacterium sp. SORGH_AS_0888]